ncbi:MAG: oligoribonuclease [Proteobacteria bacterium]|nr:oligoribonuclease [Pseudomonadota bacterium]
MGVNDKNLIWIDLEMTGLKPLQDQIIEIATVVTDKNLVILAQGPVIAIHQPLSVMNAMDSWNTRHHGDSGLSARVADSVHSAQDAEVETLNFLRQYVSEGKSPMCGNSICQDRRFMARLMPELEAFFHYRNLDVSTLKELASRWKPEVLEGFVKKSAHLALNDILDSIDELKHYRDQFLKL